MLAVVSQLLNVCSDEYLFEYNSRGLDQDDLKYVSTDC